MASLIKEGYEGSGYEVAGWAEVINGSNVVLEDYSYADLLSSYGIGYCLAGTTPGSQILAAASTGAGDPNAYAWNSFTSSNAVYCRFYFCVVNDDFNNSEKARILQISESGVGICFYIYVWRDAGGDLECGMTYYNGSLVDTAVTAISGSTWYCVTVMYENGLGGGWEWALNGTQIDSGSGLAGGRTPDLVGIGVLANEGTDTGSTVIGHDLLEIDDSAYPDIEVNFAEEGINVRDGADSAIYISGGPEKAFTKNLTEGLRVAEHSPANLITNGDFESGGSGDPWIPTGWEAYNAPAAGEISEETVDMAFGSSALKYDNLELLKGIRTATTLSLSSGDRLELNVWLKRTSGTLRLWVYDGFDTDFFTEINSGYSDWTRYTEQWTCAASGNYRFYLRSSSNDCSFLIDAVSIIRLDQGPVKSLTKVLSEAVDIGDSFTRVVSFLRSFTEGATIADSVAKSVTKILTDTANIADSFGKAVTKVVSDGVTISESAIQGIIRHVDPSGVWTGVQKIYDLLGRAVWGVVSEVTDGWTKVTEKTSSFSKVTEQSDGWTKVTEKSDPWTESS